MARFAQVTIAAALGALVALAAWVWVGPEPSREPLPAAAVAGTSTDEELCLGLERAMRVMGKGVIHELRLHRAAHIKYKKHQIAFGPEDKPGTVLYIWRTTLHKGMLHSGHFEELDSIMQAKGCLADVSESPPR